MSASGVYVVAGVTYELGLSAAGVDLGPAALLHGLAVEGGTGRVESGAGEHDGCRVVSQSVFSVGCEDAGDKCKGCACL